MKKITLIVISFFAILSSYGQGITGVWHGVLKVQGTQLRLDFNIMQSNNVYSATMDSPDQGAKGIPVSSISYENSILKLEISNANIKYEAKLNKEGVFIGTFKQFEREYPMNLSKNVIKQTRVRKPQEPTEPYPYYTEEITFKNDKANITLAGTLSLPKKEGNFPVVILISGSGAQNRDEEILGHKPFLIIADYLTRNGIGVLRYDDRGTAKSTGNFKTATSADFATDVESAILYLKTRKEVNKNKIGLIGHSEGGLIAPMIAYKSKDVAFIVLLAGTGIQGDQILLLQQKLIGKKMGLSDEILQINETMNTEAFNIAKSTNDITQLRADLTQYLTQALANNPIGIPKGINKEDFIKKQVDGIINPWFLYFIRHNPAPILQKVKCPVLALNGEKDLQVPSKVNLQAIKQALEKGGNKNARTKELANLNHLFQECTTGLPTEYGLIKQTFSPIALKEILDWILKQVE